MVICYIGVGSNLGNRRKNIAAALKEVNVLNHTKILKRSGLIKTDPVGGPKNQGKFLNGAVKIKTSLSAKALLSALKKIERRLGRKKSLRYAPRIIDLDILLYGDEIINTKQLVVPHPRMFERDFVLKPLAEII